MNQKEIFLLIGQKGSGKSFIGSIFDKHFGIRFVRVEDWAKKIKQERAVDNEAYLKQVFQEIEKGIRDCLNQTDKLVFESTGLTEHFDRMLLSLRKDFRVTTIGINADSNLCLDRVKSRDQTIHINISDDQVNMINEKVRSRNFQPDLSIFNQNKSEFEIVKELESIFRMDTKQNEIVKPNR
ncbi:nucleoside/nucleotide kinase family protein [Fulvivirga lutea]|uniref:Shikimate kinase n=1 Tax=Fulvivirga lutea TaxID=2810512 RepID=A0A974WJC4_9BACT|nr:hypothetical protein [Fulvivirga lutea]QSE97220.1 hypothetical protein JR347_16760 [Fulvivirga lutea]